MESRFLSEREIVGFRDYLLREEKSANTVEKYLRDIRAFAAFAGDREVTKKLVVEFKQELLDRGYAVRSINSMLAGINSLFAFLGWSDCRVKAIRRQSQLFCSEDRELTKAEYLRLLDAARQKSTTIFSSHTNVHRNFHCGTYFGNLLLYSVLYFHHLLLVFRGKL